VTNYFLSLKLVSIELTQDKRFKLKEKKKRKTYFIPYVL